MKQQSGLSVLMKIEKRTLRKYSNFCSKIRSSRSYCRIYFERIVSESRKFQRGRRKVVTGQVTENPNKFVCVSFSCLSQRTCVRISMEKENLPYFRLLQNGVLIEHPLAFGRNVSLGNSGIHLVLGMKRGNVDSMCCRWYAGNKKCDECKTRRNAYYAVLWWI